MVDEFDAGQRIAGFPLASIKKALTFLDITEGRDGLRTVGKQLRCGPRQAAAVLDELEEHGFVTKSEKRNQWTSTPKGRRLAFHWQPPRRYRPIIERDDKNSLTNQGFEDVPCLLFGSQDDQDVFEEARLHVLFWAEFEGDHLVEVSVLQPEDYDDPDSGGTITHSAYVTPANARAIAAGLQKAADIAEKEVARRAKHPPPKRSRPAPRARPESTSRRAPKAVEAAQHIGARAPTRPARPRMMQADRGGRAATDAEGLAPEKKRQRAKRR